MRPTAITALLVLSVSTQASGQTLLTPQDYQRLKEEADLPADAGLATHGPVHLRPTGSTRDNDGGCSCWVVPDSTYTLASEEADDVINVVAHLPFTFNFYGESFDSLYVNMNGNVSFGSQYIWYPGGSFAGEFPFGPEKMLAPFYADVDIRDTTDTVPTSYLHGRLLYKVTPHAFYLNWEDVGYYGYQGDLRNSFQLIITDGSDPAVPDSGNVSFCYRDMQWTTGNASDGENGFGGVSATVGANRGDAMGYAQVGRFNVDDDSYIGPYDEVNGVHWLDSMHFYLNTADPAGVHPIFGSPFECDSLVIGVGDAGTYRIECIAGAVDEVVTCTSSCPDIAAYQQLPTVADDHAAVLFSFHPTAGELGAHDVQFSAENDDGTPLTSMYTLHVLVVDSTSTGFGANAGANGLRLFPDPAAEHCTLDLGNSPAPEQVLIRSVDGRVCRSYASGAKAKRMDLDLTGLRSGRYTVCVVGQDQVRVLPLIITGPALER